ncbi:hypothetical protein [uncultured Massilia sp.]|uniref:hypothetical protein n=1 Tax=uncultured Massilia sp. TaxID=169973 RepID=UPI0025F00668|nr:hypothetical protein [uncultured Massilia sp.]
MDDTTTVTVNGQVYEMGTPERAQEANAWAYAHPGDAGQFLDHFQDAQVIGTPVGSTMRQQ